MADEAFALSPISARPTPPSEADYEAIRAAFVETSRGRWFLGEYARRNRNADTTMVLDAVARIERSIIAKPQSATSLADAIATITAFVTDAQTDAADSLAAIERSAELASSRKSARVIREIAWSLRECGTDARICDILDAQLRGIDALNELAGSSRQTDTIADAFDRLLMRIDGLAEGEPETHAEPPAVDSRPAPVVSPTITIDGGGAASRPQFDKASKPMDVSLPETSLAEAALADIAYPEDDAMLDLIAHEMGAPQDDMPGDSDALLAEHPIVAVTERDDPEITSAVTVQPEPSVASAPPLQPEPESNSLQPSLGEALIASGVVRAPMSASNDPLAAIRRLSQAEKIALFS